LGQVSVAQGANRSAETFFKKALEIDPANVAASDGLKEIAHAEEVLRVAVRSRDQSQDEPGAPATETPPPGSGDAKATLEQARAAENVTRQQLTDAIEQRLKAAQELVNQSQPEAAMNALRLALNVIRSASDITPTVTRHPTDRPRAGASRAGQVVEQNRDDDAVVTDRAFSQSGSPEPVLAVGRGFRSEPDHLATVTGRQCSPDSHVNAVREESNASIHQHCIHSAVVIAGRLENTLFVDPEDE
jgi:hypothetical protein